MAGNLNAGTVTASEVYGDAIYARRLMLVDPDGKPYAVRINSRGEIEVDYDYKDVFIYPKDVDVRKFVYRYLNPKNLAANFTCLTPVELMLNFVPYTSTQNRVMDEKTCPLFCAADGVDEVVKNTVLFTCPQTKKITGVEILDENG